MPAFAPDVSWPCEPQPVLRWVAGLLVAASLLGAILVFWGTGCWMTTLAVLGTSLAAALLGAKPWVAGELRWAAGTWQFCERKQTEPQPIHHLARVLTTPWGDALKADARWLWLPKPELKADAATRECWRGLQRALLATPSTSLSATLSDRHG